MSNARNLANNLSALVSAEAPIQGATGNRNLIINGSMQVWQRGTGTTTISNSTYPTVDRFRCYTGGAQYSSTRSTDVPSGQGFGFSNRFDVVAADNALGAGSFYVFKQRIEGNNCMRLAYGSSAAKTVTLSFWVKSNKTGTYAISLYKFDGTSYTYVKNYTINSADTWEKKEITITPTAGGTSYITNSPGQIANDNSHGLDVNFILSVGSNHTGGTDDSWSTNLQHYATSSNVNWMDNTANNFYITGVQLEEGTKATAFEFEDQATIEHKCFRYFYKSAGYNLALANATTVGYSYREERSIKDSFPVPMRTSPTLTAVSGIQALNSGGMTIYGDRDHVVVYSDTYPSDLPSGNYWYGGYTAEAEL